VPTCKYQAVTADGKATKGTLDAENLDDAGAMLRAQGLFPQSVVPDKARKRGKKGVPDAGAAETKRKKPLSLGGVSQKKLTLFTRQLSTLQDAGLPLLRSVQILESQQRGGMMKYVLASVADDVAAGSTLADSMARHPGTFDRLYSKMIAAGEVGGVLDVILQRLAVFMEKAQALKRRVIGAMIYPVVVIIIAVLIVTGIMYFVIPKFIEIFNDFEVELPGLTIFLTEASAWVAGSATPDQQIPGAAWIVVSPFIIFVLWKIIRKIEIGRKITDRLLLISPPVGGLLRKTAVARFTRTLGTLIAAGVPILEAITITKETSGNSVFEDALGKVHDSIREGESFAEPLRKSKVVDELVVNMIEVGEETGDLDVMLMKVADNYDEEVDVAVQGLTRLIEPLLVVFLGGVIGTIVLALFLPLVKMIESVSQGG